MKNVVCLRLRTVLHLDIQKGKEAKKAPSFQKDLGATNAFIKRLAIVKKGCVQLT